MRMKVTRKKGFYEDNKKYIKIALYIILALIIIVFSYLIFNKIKPILPIDVQKVSMPQNNPSFIKKNYIYIVTDDSDYINHDLSNERYKVLLDLVRQNKTQVLWNVLLSGAEFEYLKRTNQENKILYDLQNQLDEDYTKIGYSAKNESKYISDLRYFFSNKKNNVTFKDAVKKTYEFLTCGKNEKTGECLPYSDNEGGPGIIKITIGDFYTSSGIDTDNGLSNDAVSKALMKIVKNNNISINFSKDKIKKLDLAKKFIKIMSPVNTTSSTLFWINNQIVITNWDIKNNIGVIDTVEDSDIINKIEKIKEKNDISVTPVYFGGTNLYSKVNPVKYAYKNGGYKKLQIDKKYRQLEKDKKYELNASNFKKIIDLVYKDSHFEFINSKKIYNKVINADYINITKQELDRMARWIIIEWNKKGRIPSWVYDGKNYYSLRDVYYLLYKAFSDREKTTEHSLPKANIQLTNVFGPYKVVDDNTLNTRLSRKIIMEIIIKYMRIAQTDGYWEKKNDDSYGNSRDTIDPFYRRGRIKITAAEMLYAMSVIYTMDYHGKKIEDIYIPPSKTYPETYELLRDGFGCINKEYCIATSWSLKPIRIE